MPQRIFVLLLLLLVVMPIATHAQTPSISVIEGWDEVTAAWVTYPLPNSHFWTLWGNNLSTGSGSTVAIYYMIHYVGPPVPYYSEWYHLHNSSSAVWYESAYQLHIWGGHTADMLDDYEGTGSGRLIVCNSYSLCSSNHYFAYNCYGEDCSG